MAQKVMLDGFGLIELPDNYAPDDITRHLNSREFKSFVEVNDPAFYDQHYDQDFIDTFQLGLSDAYSHLTEQFPNQIAASYYDLLGDTANQQRVIETMKDYVYQRSLMGKPVKYFTELFTEESTFNDWIDFVGYHAGGALPSAAAVMGTSGAAALAAAVSPIGIPVATAATTGAIIAGTTLGFGDIYEAQVKAKAKDPNMVITTSLAPLYGLAERLGVGGLVSSILKRRLAATSGKEAAEEIVGSALGSALGRIGKNAATGALKTSAGEGVAEALQGAIAEIGGFLDTSGNEQTFAEFVTSQDFLLRRINDAAAGVVGGATIGGGLGAVLGQPSPPKPRDDTRSSRRNIVPKASEEAIKEANDFALAERDSSRLGQEIGLRPTENFKPNKDNIYKVLSDFITPEGTARSYVLDPTTNERFFVDRTNIYEPETLTPQSLIEAISTKIREDESNPQNIVDEEFVAKLFESDLSQYKDTPSIKQFGDMEELSAAVRDNLENQEVETASNSSPYSDAAQTIDDIRNALSDLHNKTDNAAGNPKKARESLKAKYRGYSQEYIDSLTDDEAIDLATSGAIYLTPEDTKLLDEFNIDPAALTGKSGRDRLNFLKENADQHRATLKDINNADEKARKAEAARTRREETYNKERKTSAFIYGPENRAKFSKASSLDYDLTKGKSSPVVLKAAQETIKSGDQFLTQEQANYARETISNIEQRRAEYNEALEAMELPTVKDWDNYARQKDTPFRKLQRQVNRSAITSAPKLSTEIQDGVSELTQAVRDIIMQIAPHASSRLMELKPNQNMIDNAAIVASGGIPTSTANAAGAYDPITKMIWIAMNGSLTDVADATVHEIYHYLEDNNFFSETDQQIILNAMPLIRSKAIQIIQSEINPNVNPQNVADYEARAIYVAHYLRARLLKRNDVLKKIPTSLRGIANRVYKLFDFVNNWMNNRGTPLYGANKIFDDIGNGMRTKPIGDKSITQPILLRATSSIASVVRGLPKTFSEDNFRKWFRNSAVVESASKKYAIPKTVYHATPSSTIFEGAPGTLSPTDTFKRGDDLGIHFGTQRAAMTRLGKEQPGKFFITEKLLVEIQNTGKKFGFTMEESASVFRNYVAKEIEPDLTKGTPEAVSLYNALRDLYKKTDYAPRVIPVYLSIQNPLYMPDMGFWDAAEIIDAISEIDGYPPGSYYIGPTKDAIPQQIVFSAEEADTLIDKVYELNKKDSNDLLIEALKKKGIDGIIYKNNAEDEGSTSYIVFDPTQIKSIYNNGEWSLNNGNIAASARPVSNNTTPSTEKETFSTEESDANIEKDAAALRQFIPRPDLPASGRQEGGLVDKDIGKFSSFVNSMRHMARKNKFFAAVNSVYQEMGIYKNWHSNEIAKYGRILAELNAEQLQTVGKAVEAVVHIQKQYADNPDVPKRYRPDAQGRIIIQSPDTLGALGSNSILKAGEVIILTGNEAQAYVDLQDGFNYVLTENKRGYMHHKVPFIRNMLNKYIPNSPIALNEEQATKEAFEKFGSQAPALTLNPLEDIYHSHLIEIRSAIEANLDGAMASLFGPGMSLGEMPSGGWKQNIKDGKLVNKLSAVSKEITALNKAAEARAAGKKPKKRKPRFPELLDHMFPEELAQLKTDIDNAIETLNKVTVEYNDITDILKNVKDFDSLLARDYMPLMRFGDHFIAFKDLNGKIVWYEQLEFYDETTSTLGRIVKNTQLKTSTERREKFANQRSAEVSAMLASKGIEAIPVEDARGNIVFDVTKGNLQALPGMSAQSINLLFSQLHRSKNLTGTMSQDQLNLIRDEVQKMIDGRGFSRFMKERDLVPGYTIDLRRAFAQYAMTGIYTAASTRYKPALSTAVNRLKENFGEHSNLYKYAVAAQNYIESPMEELEKLRSLSFFYHLGANVSSGLLQVIGAAQFSMPYISQFAGTGATASAFRKAFTEIAPAFSPIIRDPEFPEVALDIGKLPTDKGMKEALMRALEAGTLKQGAFLDMMGYGPDERIQSERSAKLARRIRNVLAAPFSTFETMTRLTTFTAAYRLARDNPAILKKFVETAVANDEALKAMFQNVDKITPYDFATVMVDDTLGLFGRGNRPPFMRGVGGLIFQFQFYPLQMLEFMATLFKNYKTNKTAIAGIVLMLFLTSGVSGLPGADDAEKLASMLMKKTGLTDKDIRIVYREAMYEMGAPGWTTELFEKGTFNAMGFDVQRRVGFGELPGSQQAQALLGLSKNQADMYGAPGAMILGSMQGFYDLGVKQGRWSEALTYTLPSVLRNPVRSIQYAEGGVRSRSGLQIVPEDVLTLGELAGKAIGFQPNRISLAYQRDAEVRDLETVMRNRKTAIVRRLENAMFERVKASRENDRRAFSEADADITAIYRKLMQYNNNSPPETRIALDGPTMRQINIRIRDRLNPKNRIIRDVPVLQRFNASEVVRRYDDQFFNRD